MEALMAGLMCARCGQPLRRDDGSCRTCGTPAPHYQTTAPQPGGAPNGHYGATLSSAGAGAPFFRHEPARPPGRLNNSTRYLCAAAYLDHNFAKRVIGGLLLNRRAVAPSLNVDIGPVIWHCRRARRNLLFRNIVLYVIVLAGGHFLDQSATYASLSCAAILGSLPAARWRQRGPASKILFVIIALCVLLLLLYVIYLTLVFSRGDSFVPAHKYLTAWAKANKGKMFRIWGTFFLLPTLALGTEFAYLFLTNRILTRKLRLGALPPPDPAKRSADSRIAMVEGAQWGNIALYATDDPFIGAGYKAEPEREWSIAIRLNPADPVRQVLHTRPSTGAWIPIDPVELHRAIREKLFSLNDPRLPVSQRIVSLSVADRLVGSGALRWDSPLVDASRRMPYSTASREAVEAIIRHPQARLRYYQHVMVNDEGPPVISGDRLVLDAADLGISISAFVYAAVEGRHLYVQFILTALPPIKQEYRIIDSLPGNSSGKMLRTILKSSIRGSLRSLPVAGQMLYQAWRHRAREKRAEQEALHGDEWGFGQLGAEVSIRELAMADRLGSYIHVLDIRKYNSIIERAVLETVQDFLASKGVDISAFTDSASNVINGNVIGSVSGGTNQFGGTDSTFHQNQSGRTHKQHRPGSI
jgi:hypothetical protein